MTVDGCWVVEGVVGEHGVGVSVAGPVVARLGGRQLHGERYIGMGVGAGMLEKKSAV